MDESRNTVLRRRIRWILALFMAALVVSGLTAIPLETELDWLAAVLNIPPDAEPSSLAGLRYWIAFVRAGVHETYAKYPFMAYGTDWLAFAHVIIAVAFVGPWRDPVRNAWVIDFGLIACPGVIPLALVFGPLHGIPFYWQLIDCSFGVFGCIPLWIVRPTSRNWKRPMTTEADLYDPLVDKLRSLLTDERDAVANMANMAALVYHNLPDVNWAGFYRLVGEELVLGPFQGKPACVRIKPEGVRRGRGDAADARRQKRPRVPWPHRLRSREQRRTGRAAHQGQEVLRHRALTARRSAAIR